MKRSTQKIVFTGMVILLSYSLAFAAEINSHYVTLIYRDEEQLSEFGEKALNAVSCNEKNATITAEIKSKLDLLVENCIKILIDAPNGECLRFKIVILASVADIRKSYSDIYGRGTDYIAFYSPKVEAVFISLDKLRRGILAHEIAHVIMHHYFYNVSRIVHEDVAQMVETQSDK